jgi:hypothetical protein
MLRLFIFLDQQFGEGDRSDGWRFDSTGLFWWLGVLLLCLLISAAGVYVVGPLGLRARP